MCLRHDLVSFSGDEAKRLAKTQASHDIEHETIELVRHVERTCA